MRKIRLLFGLLMAAVLANIASGPALKAAPNGSPPRPNIVFILTDDLDTRYPEGTWVNRFPRLRTILSDQGTTFKNNFVTLSLCCPSRTSILRGQYAHNTQIFTNASPGGGFQKAHDLGLEDSTFATWLQEAGYKTVLLGKYLNGYPGNLGRSYVPPGWDEWYSGQRNQYQQFNYDMNENGKIVSYGSAPEDYLQDVIRGKATDFIRRTANEGRPFMMWMTTYSPHQPATFAPRHADRFPNARAPRPPTFNQPDVSHMPSWVQNRPLLGAAQIRTIDALHQKRLKSMVAVVETIDDIINTLRETGQLDNTYIFFSSDNGFHLGQHRLPPGKNTEFEEDLHVPLIVRGPGVPSGRVLEHMTVNIDLAPTFAELAGIPIPANVDGRSLRPLLRETPTPLADWRQGFLLEHGYIQTADAGRTSADARSAAEAQRPYGLAGPLLPQPFQGLHIANHVYVEYVPTGERELYNLAEDVYQQISLADTSEPELLQWLSAWLGTLRRCIGAECRRAEDILP
ncbi:MAG: sulfatase [Acidobacteria bacterium]|nr:sulfatase [Acidobacteriota bacterium]MBI3656632.1 sulfatase [Acidobacteriota bacterium]